MRERAFVYILTNANNTVLYVGMTNDIERRIGEHKAHLGSSFCRKYKVTKLVHLERFDRIVDAIAREKQLKAGPREKKMKLINGSNRLWQDLAYGLESAEVASSLRSSQ